MKADGDIQALSKVDKIRGLQLYEGRFVISDYLNLSKEKEHVGSKRLSLWPPAGGEKGEMYIPLMLADHSQSRSDFNSSSPSSLSSNSAPPFFNSSFTNNMCNAMLAG